MKKTVSIFLASVMALALFACESKVMPGAGARKVGDKYMEALLDVNLKEMSKHLPPEVGEALRQNVKYDTLGFHDRLREQFTGLGNEFAIDEPNSTADEQKAHLAYKVSADRGIQPWAVVKLDIENGDSGWTITRSVVEYLK